MKLNTNKKWHNILPKKGTGLEYTYFQEICFEYGKKAMQRKQNEHNPQW